MSLYTHTISRNGKVEVEEIVLTHEDKAIVLREDLTNPEKIILEIHTKTSKATATLPKRALRKLAEIILSKTKN